MKFEIEKKTLEKAMSHSIGVIDRKQASPILGYVLMTTSVEENRLKIVSTSMDMTIIDSVECNVESSGSYCVPANLLYDITKKMKSNSQITIGFDDEQKSIVLKSARSNFSIHYMEGANFPPIANISFPVRFSLNSKVFQKSIDVAKVAMLQDNTRFHLNGIHMHYENDSGMHKLNFVATDLFRISCVSIVAPADAQNMPPIIVSKKAVGEIIKLADDSNSENIDVSVSENRISFNIEGGRMKTEFSTRLINGTFPEYKSALNVSNDKILLVNTEEFREAIDRVSTVVMDNTNSIRFNISADKLVLTGVSRELGTAVEEIEASFNAFEPLEICFNSKYLTDILNKIETEQVKLLLAESSSSTIIKPTDDAQGMIFAVMPVEVIKT
jgi:DNA polymerase-3 subunit beta